MNEVAELSKKLRLPGEAPHLAEAFTHRSYAVEHDLAYDNQRLEFLGDAVLEIIQTEYLFRRCPEATEGQLTKLRSALACEGALAEWARRLELGTLLKVGRGEEDNGGAARRSTLADLFEAVLGAVYLDLGMAAAREFVLPLLESTLGDPDDLLLELNPKGRLQELTQRIFGGTPQYLVLGVSGPQHQPVFKVEARAGGWVTVGDGTSRKHAESRAAAQLYRYLSEFSSK
jgi:ribonuclease-3